MSIYHSGFSDSIEAFVNSRKMSGAWNETVFGLNIRIFDRYCARHYPTEALRQEMVDIWCTKRETENVNSCYTRTLVIRLFIEYLHKHGKADILPPPVLKQDKKRRIPMRSAGKNWNGSSMNVTASHPAEGGWLMLLN